MLKLWGIQSTPSLPSFQGPLWLGVVAPDRVLSMGLMELNSVLMQKSIIWNRIVFFFIENVLRRNWIVWNRTVWLNRIAWNRNVLTIKLCTHAKLNYLEKKLIIWIKMNLALNNRQRLIWYKIQPTNQPTNQPYLPIHTHARPITQRQKHMYVFIILLLFYVYIYIYIYI